jgi:hypothetical protein
MTIRNEDTLRQFLDIVVSRPHLGSAMEAVGGKPQTIWSWLKKSSQGDKNFLVKWPDPDGEPIQFADALVLARKQSAVIYESILRDEIMNGVKRVQINSGKLVYAEDPRYIGVPDDVMVMLGLDEPSIEYWRILRDPITKLPVPLTVCEPLAAHIRIRGAQALLPSWRDQRTVDINQRVSGGVMVVNASPTPVESRPIDVECTPALPPPEMDVDVDDQPGDTEEVAALKARLRQLEGAPEMAPEDELPEWSPTPVASPAGPPRAAPARGFRVAAG